MSRNVEESGYGWKTTKLRDVALVGAGNSAPQGAMFFENGIYPFIRTQDVGRLHIHPALSETTDYVNDLAVESKRLKLWPEKSLLIPKSGASTFLNHRVLTAVPAYIASHLAVVVAGDQVLPEYLYFWSLTVDTRRIAPENNYPSLRLSDLEEIELPIPPLPVQERIVQILQKADEISRKRERATLLAEQTMRAIFIDMFGDPVENPKGFPVISLGDVISEGPQNGLYKPHEAYGSGVSIVRTKNYYAGALGAINDLWRLECTPDEISKYRLNSGDILVNRVNSVEYVGKCALVPDLHEDVVFESNTMRFRVDPSRAFPEYVVAFLCSGSSRRQIEEIGARRRAVNMVSINQKNVKEFRLPLAPIDLQSKFLESIRQYTTVASTLMTGFDDATALFSGLLFRAFSGQLTAEWELANKGWIVNQVELQEQLPRLLLLALIRERVGQKKKADQTAIFMTSLMKYAFLFQMESNFNRRFYHFVPYYYGPFAKEIYIDLERLQTENLVTVDNETDEDKIRITLANPALADLALAEFPDNLKQEVADIISTYGNLDYNDLLKTVYKKYPMYAKKSRVRKRIETNTGRS